MKSQTCSPVVFHLTVRGLGILLENEVTMRVQRYLMYGIFHFTLNSRAQKAGKEDLSAWAGGTRAKEMIEFWALTMFIKHVFLEVT